MTTRSGPWRALLATALAAGSAAAQVTLGPPGPVTWCNARFSRVYRAAQNDVPTAAAVDASGNTYVTGYTQSPNFPVTPGAFDTSYNGGMDGFVLELSPTGSIVYATFLGGTSDDWGFGIAVDGQGQAFVAGITFGQGFPVTAGAFDPTFNGGDDQFVTKLSAGGSTLVYSTFLGGTDLDKAWGIAVDGGGRAYVTGDSLSADFPTTPGAFDPFKGAGRDATVVALAPAGDSLHYATFVKGNSWDSGMGIAVDPTGSAYVAGLTSSVDFPVTPGAAQPAYGGGSGDGFVVRLSPSGASLVMGTYLGGTSYEEVAAIAVDGTGAAFALGDTNSTDFPVTAGAFDATLGGSQDSFVTRLAPGGSAFSYSTFLGGTQYEVAGGLAVDSQGSAHVVGTTASTDFPVTPGACQLQNGGDSDGYVVHMSPAGSTLIYGTYMGAARSEGAWCIGLSSAGARHVAGSIALPPSYDVFVTVLP